MAKKPYVWAERPIVISAMRRAFRRYPPFKQCLDAAKSEYFIPSKKGKPMRRVHWECAQCKKKVTNKDKAVDHLIPVVDPVQGFQSYDVYAQRLFCSIDNLQILCNTCHKLKTKAEAALRRKVRKDTNG